MVVDSVVVVGQLLDPLEVGRTSICFQVGDLFGPSTGESGITCIDECQEIKYKLQKTRYPPGNASSISSKLACGLLGPPPKGPNLGASLVAGGERSVTGLDGAGESKGSSTGTALRPGLGTRPTPARGAGSGSELLKSGCGAGGNGSDDGSSATVLMGTTGGGLVAGGTAGSGLELERVRPAPMPG